MATERSLTPTTNTTPLPPAIVRFLAAARRWLRLRAALTGAGFGLAAGLALGVAIGLAARLRPWLLPDQTTLAALGAVLVATLLGALVNAVRPLSTRAVAARYDHDLGLRERLGTALELMSGATHSALAGQHLAETARLVAGCSPRAVALPRPGRDTLLRVGALAVALAALLLVPNDQTTAIQQRQAQQQLVQQAAQQVGQAQARVAARTDLDPATQAALQQQLAQLQRDLADGKLDPAQAVARIAQTEAGLRRLQDPNAANQAAGLPQLADEFGTFSATAPIGQKLQAGDYAGAAQALKNFASQLQGLDPASRAAIAQKLREAAASQAATNPQLAQQFQHAADLLDSGDIAGAQAALNAAADQLQQAGQAAAAQTVLSGTLGDLGAIKRDVANGQPPTTANATPQLPGGTPIALSGTPATLNGTPFPASGSPVALDGTPVVLGQGTPVRPTSGTPPANATPVIVQGTGQGQGQAQGQGTGQGQGVGQGQSGQGQGQGQGQNQGQGAGNGSGGGYGSGSGSNPDSPTTGSAPAGNPQGSQSNQQGTQPYDPVYAPTFPGGASGQQQQVGDTGGSAPPSGTTPGQGANTPSSVPYNQVYGQYRDQAQQAIDNGAIPPELRDYIQQYFSNIDPNSQQK